MDEYTGDVIPLDPELQKQLDSARTNPLYNQPIKPSKYNLDETRTPYELLLAEAAGQPNTRPEDWNKYTAVGLGLKKEPPKEYTGEVLPLDSSTPPSLAAVAASAPKEYTGEVLPLDTPSSTPGIMDVAKGAEALRQAVSPQALVGGAARAGIDMFAGIPGSIEKLGRTFLTNETGQQIEDAGNATNQAISGIVDKVVGNDYLPKVVQDLLPNMKDSIQSKAVSMPLSYPIEKGLEGVQAIGNLAGPEVGWAARHGVEGLMAAAMLYPVAKAPFKIASSYKEAAVLGKINDAHAEARLQESINDLGTKIDEAIPVRQRAELQPNEPYQAAVARTVAHNGKLVDALDYLSKGEDLPEYQKQLAKAIADRGYETGLDNVRLYREDLSDAPAQYTDITDEIRMGSQAPSPYMVLHEGLHAVQTSALKIYKETPAENIKDLTPKQMDMWKAGERIDNLYNHVVKKAADEMHIEVPELLDRLQRWEDMSPLEKDKLRVDDPAAYKKEEQFYGKHYGMKDVYEFGAEALSNRAFAHTLNNVMAKPTPEVIAAHKYNGPRPSKSGWDEYKAAMKQAVSEFSSEDRSGTTYLDLAMEHMTNFLDLTKPGERHGMNDASIDAATKRLDEMVTAKKKLVGETSQIQMDALQKLAALRELSKNFDSFVTRMSLEPYFRNNPDFIQKYAKKIYDNPLALDRLVVKPKTSSYMSSEAAWMHESRTFSQFIKDEFPNVKQEDLPRLDEDLTKFGTKIFNPTTLSHTKFDGPAGKFLRYMFSQALQYTSLKTRAYTAGLDHLKDFAGKGAIISRREALDLYDVMQGINTLAGRKELRSKGLQWADDAMLKDRGMNDNQIKAYHGINKMHDLMFTLTNEARAAHGLEPIPQIPGYMHNVHEQPYKVMVERKEWNAETERWENAQNVHVQGFGGLTREGFGKQQAIAYVKELASGKLDTDKYQYRAYKDPNTTNQGPYGGYYRTYKHGDTQQPLATSIQEHMKNYQNQMQLEPHTLQLLEEMEENSMRGMLKSSLERSDISGYLGQEGSKRGAFEKKLGPIPEIGYGENNRMLASFQNYAKQVSDYYGNTLFLKEVMLPMLDIRPLDIKGSYYGHLTENMLNLRRFLKEFGYQVTGENINHLSWVDDFFNRVATTVGYDPHLHKAVNREFRNWISVIALRANPRNYLANVMQPTQILPMLELNNLDRSRQGLPTFSSLQSFTDGMARALKPDNYTLDAVHWLNEMHYTDARLTNEISDSSHGPFREAAKKWVGSEINNFVERASRQNTFIIALEHFRKVYPDDPIAARESAAHTMRMIMVDYEMAQRPGMFANTGITGEAISPFAMYRNNAIGNTYLLFKAAMQDPKSLQSWKPLLASQVMFWATAGVAGMMFLSEANLIIDAWNAAYPEDEVDHIEGQVQKLGSKARNMGLDTVGNLLQSTTALYGIPSGVTGVNFAPSMASVAADDVSTVPAFTTAKLVGKAIVALTKTATSAVGLGLAPSNDELWQIRNLLPGLMKLPAEALLNGNVNIASKTTGLEGYVPREPKDIAIAALTGSESTDVAKRKMILAQVTKNEKARTTEIKKLVDMAVDKQVGGMTLSKADYASYLARWSSLNPDKGPDEFAKAIAAGVLKRMTGYVDQITNTGISPDTQRILNEIQKRGYRK